MKTADKLEKSREFYAVGPDKNGPTFDDFFGNKATKDKLEEIITSMLYPRIFSAFGLQNCKGVLLEGPPGNGKSWFIDCLQTELFNRNKYFARMDYNIGQSGSPYINENSVILQDFFDMGLKILEGAYDGVIYFFDEAEVIMGTRSNVHENKEDKKMLETLMKNMQNVHLRKSNEYMFFATNYSKLMDKAAMRSGRIDEIVKFDNPDIEARRNLYLNKKNQINKRAGYNVFPNLNCKELSRNTDNVSCSDCYAIIESSVRNKLIKTLNDENLHKKPILLPLVYMSDVMKTADSFIKNRIKKEKSIGF